MNWTNLKFYAAYAFIVFFIVILFFEILLRTITPFSTGTGDGIGRKWIGEFWKPINSMGYRDEEPIFDSDRSIAIFLGDSFTAGHGVKYEETYFYLVKKMIEKSYVSANLGQNGTSTSRQIANYRKFLDSTNIKPDVVVYQYFGNDIADFISIPKMGGNAIQQALSKLSYLYSFVDSYFFIKKFGQEYVENLRQAYSNSDTFLKHKTQILELYQLFDRGGSKVIFLVFPFLNNKFLLAESQAMYIEGLREFFRNNCKNGDLFYDASNIALTLKQIDRIVNFMDAHPSKKLHALVAQDLVSFLASNKSLENAKSVLKCEK